MFILVCVFFSNFTARIIRKIKRLPQCIHLYFLTIWSVLQITLHPSEKRAPFLKALPKYFSARKIKKAYYTYIINKAVIVTVDAQSLCR